MYEIYSVPSGKAETGSICHALAMCAQVAQSDADRLRDDLTEALASQQGLQASLAESELEVYLLNYLRTRA